ncbi:hypothetical protein B5K11_19990 [Rhizobium leguminosarum bv. trifolii]|nr:hypothetical protein B5K11_19990 [Rhizobium leguminosarum bv. trifolii]
MTVDRDTLDFVVRSSVEAAVLSVHIKRMMEISLLLNMPTVPEEKKIQQILDPERHINIASLALTDIAGKTEDEAFTIIKESINAYPVFELFSTLTVYSYAAERLLKLLFYALPAAYIVSFWRKLLGRKESTDIDLLMNFYLFPRAFSERFWRASVKGKTGNETMDDI